MADNLSAPASGASLATRELPDGAHAGKVVVVGADGETLSPATDPALYELACILRRIADGIGQLMPDSAGRLRVAAETLGTLSTITTVTTVATVTNMAQIGGIAANQSMLALTLGNESDLRRNVVIS